MHRVLSLLLGAAALATAACGPAAHPEGQAAPPAGLRVTEVKAGYPGARAGLAAGDWIVGAGSGAGDSELGPNRWALLEAEAGSLGPVSLAVERSGRRLTLELPPSPWGVKVAPPLAPELREALGALPEPEAIAALRAAAAGAPPVTAAWLQLEIAGAAGDDEGLRAAALDAAVGAAAGSGDPTVEAWAWWQRGDLLWRANAHPAARDAYGRALELLADRPLAAAAILVRRGISFFNTTDEAAAQADFEQAAARIRRVTDASVGLAQALNLLAQCQANRSEIETAAGNLARAAAMIAALDPEHPLGAQIEYQRGRLAEARGDLAEADRRFDAAFSRYTAAGIVSRDVGNVLMGMSALSSLRGDLLGAEARARSALAIFETEAPGSPHHIWALRALGDISLRRGQTATAAALFGQALELAGGEASDRTSAAEVHWHLADLAERKGRLQEAVEHYRRALAIFEARLPGSAQVPSLQTEMGRVALDLGDRDTARAALEGALERWRELAAGGLWEGWASYQLGRLARQEGRGAEALALLRSAQRAFHRLAPDTVAEAEIGQSTAGVLRDLGRVDEAVAAYEEAVGALERQLPRLGSPEVGAEERARHRSLYDDYLDLLVETGRTGEAFRLLERSRVRALLAMLAERDLVFRSALPADLDRERRAARAAYSQALEGLGRLSDHSPPEAVAAASRRLRLARERQEQARQEIRRRSPRLADLSDPQPLGWAAAAAALDPGTLALAYHVGAARTRIFAVARGISPRVETVAIGRDELAAKVRRYRLLLQNPASAAAARARARELSDLLLAPVASDIAAAERLLLVPDGALHLLPFGALPLPVAGGTGAGVDGGGFLAAARPLHFAASITLFAELARRRRGDGAPAGPLLVAIGDPAVGRGDEASLRGLGGEGLTPLEGARREVESIAALFGDAATVFTGAAATEARAKRLDPTVRYLHFATHAVLDERFPLDSALVLAGGAGEDGLLQAWEIFEDVVVDADLVTLSACESGLGSELAGEGLIGLTRAFHYAGARSVLASLWPVSDRSTAYLMVRFYEGLRAGLPKDEALRRAQLRLIEQPLPAPTPSVWARWTRPLARVLGRGSEAPAAGDASRPFHWAAFQLYGDWR